MVNMSWRSPSEAFQALKGKVTANYLQASLKNQYNELQNPVYSVASRTMRKLDKSSSFDSHPRLPRRHSSNPTSVIGRDKRKKFTILTRNVRQGGSGQSTNKVTFRVPTAAGKGTGRNCNVGVKQDKKASHTSPQLPAVFQTFDRGVSPTPESSVTVCSDPNSAVAEPSLLALKVQYSSAQHAKWFAILADYNDDRVPDLCDAFEDLHVPNVRPVTPDSAGMELLPELDSLNSFGLMGATISSVDC